MSGTALEFAEETPGSGCSAGIARGIVEVLTEGRANDNRPRKRLSRCDYSTERYKLVSGKNLVEVKRLQNTNARKDKSMKAAKRGICCSILLR